MKEWISRNFLQLIIIVLFGIFFLQTCWKKSSAPIESIVTTHDTVWNNHDTTIYQGGTSIQPIKRIHDTTEYNSTEYVPSENYDSLVEQFSALKEMLLTQNIYSQEYKKDSSSVVITDTIEKNKFVGRRVDFNLRYPVITNNTTITKLDRRNIVYLGGGIAGNKQNYVNSVNAGVMLKNKSDRFFGVTVGFSPQGGINYGANVYIPIKLKK